MLFLILVASFAAMTLAGCPMRPTTGQTSAGRTPGDGGYRILISGTSDKYIPDAVYTISLQGIRYDCLTFFFLFSFFFHKNNFSFERNVLILLLHMISGSRTHERLQQFTRFTLSVHSQHAPNNPTIRVGYFQLFPDSLTTFNEDCINTISEATDYPKSEVIKI